MNTENLEIGDDGVARCPWGAGTPEYVVYHDEEWGVPTTDERSLFEKLCLEGFQSGLSWLTILRKREGFREAFDNFEAAEVAAYTTADVERLMTNPAIVRHRGKIEAAINNARRLVELWDEGSGLAQLIWSHEPGEQRAPESMAQVPATTPESTALSKALKKRGFSFVGPTTAYAGMQAMGIVNDHLIGCDARRKCDQLRSRLVRP
ncbi:MAG: DNA-3-methyladenine glycosylase I [Acidimicrobiia bacterium]|nr:DNA-3-methyladenine glycosylase I [Acidimicrobiia bacterium]